MKILLAVANKSYVSIIGDRKSIPQEISNYDIMQIMQKLGMPFSVTQRRKIDQMQTQIALHQSFVYFKITSSLDRISQRNTDLLRIHKSFLIHPDSIQKIQREGSEGIATLLPSIAEYITSLEDSFLRSINIRISRDTLIELKKIFPYE